MLQFGSVAGSVRPKGQGEKERKVVTFLDTTKEIEMTVSWTENPRVRGSIPRLATSSTK